MLNTMCALASGCSKSQRELLMFFFAAPEYTSSPGHLCAQIFHITSSVFKILKALPNICFLASGFPKYTLHRRHVPFLGSSACFCLLEYLKILLHLFTCPKDARFIKMSASLVSECPKKTSHDHMCSCLWSLAIPVSSNILRSFFVFSNVQNSESSS